MSLSKQRVQNPATKFIEWKSTKSFFYYDRDKGADVEVEMPFYVVPLDVLGTIKGFDESSNSSIYSNEVHSTKNEEMEVKSFKGGKIAKGLYNDIKGDIVGRGGKFTNSVYAALVTPAKDGGKDVEMINLNFSGAALGAYIEAGIKTDGSIIEVGKNPTQQKKGAVKYYIPSFAKKNTDESIMSDCIALDEELQAYFKEYKATQGKSEESVSANKESIADRVKAEAGTDGGGDDLPF